MIGFFLPGSEEKPTEHYPNILESHHLQVVTIQKGALTSLTISRHCYFTQSFGSFLSKSLCRPFNSFPQLFGACL